MLYYKGKHIIKDKKSEILVVWTNVHGICYAGCNTTAASHIGFSQFQFQRFSEDLQRLNTWHSPSIHGESNTAN
jgi:hypothetical protein